ncbi:hypothetical protein TCON_0812 [Astathelohania contejeani]|uniref:Uncharacterized protein n=1 Tax=Astathelohania contejeani TaxID=164912 RepID=A0ABQ7I0P5_9MICR|nr:hypothetical protein TCON_0812 [Thelohania contejeani]
MDDPNFQKLLNLNTSLNIKSIPHLQISIFEYKNLLINTDKIEIINSCIERLISLFITKPLIIKKTIIELFRSIDVKSDISGFKNDILNIFYSNDDELKQLTVELVDIFSNSFIRDDEILYEIIRNYDDKCIKCLSKLVQFSNQKFILDYITGKNEKNISHKVLQYVYCEKSIKYIESKGDYDLLISMSQKNPEVLVYIMNMNMDETYKKRFYNAHPFLQHNEEKCIYDCHVNKENKNTENYYKEWLLFKKYYKKHDWKRSSIILKKLCKLKDLKLEYHLMFKYILLLLDGDFDPEVELIFSLYNIENHPFIITMKKIFEKANKFN